MNKLLLLSVCLIFNLFVFCQDNMLNKNKWGEWKTDSTRTSEGFLHVTKKRIKINSDNCLLTEEIIFYYDACNNIVRKTKVRSDCKRHMGEGDIIYERRYRSKCGR